MCITAAHTQTGKQMFIYSAEYMKKNAQFISESQNLFLQHCVFFNISSTLVSILFSSICFLTQPVYPSPAAPFALQPLSHCLEKATAFVIVTWKGEFTAAKITYSILFLRDRSPSMKNILQIFKIVISFYVVIS